MSVATKNPFAILDDDPSAAPDPVPEKEADAAAPPPPSRGTQKSRGGPASRGGKYYPRGGKPQTRDSTAAVAEEPAPDAQKKFENREGGRGRGRGGRGRGADGPGRGGRGRPFDRHSQTGKIDSDKKIHQSWGGDDGNAERKAEEAATTDANNDWATDAPAPSTADWAGTGPADSTDWAGTGTGPAAATDWAGSTAAADWGAPAPATDAPAAAEGADKPEGRPRREREPEEEDNTLTFDQYLAQKKEKDAAIPKLEGTRQANEGAGDDLWKGAVPLTKQEEEEAYFVGKSKAAPKARAKKEEKVFLEIDARFERPDRGGGRGRGGRGGDRGGDRGRGPPRGAYGRDGPRGGRQKVPTSSVNIDDQTTFPSLS